MYWPRTHSEPGFGPVLLTASSHYWWPFSSYFSLTLLLHCFLSFLTLPWLRIEPKYLALGRNLYLSSDVDLICKTLEHLNFLKGHTGFLPDCMWPSRVLGKSLPKIHLLELQVARRALISASLQILKASSLQANHFSLITSPFDVTGCWIWRAGSKDISKLCSKS